MNGTRLIKSKAGSFTEEVGESISTVNGTTEGAFAEAVMKGKTSISAKAGASTKVGTSAEAGNAAEAGTSTEVGEREFAIVKRACLLYFVDHLEIRNAKRNVAESIEEEGIVVRLSFVYKLINC